MPFPFPNRDILDDEATAKRVAMGIHTPSAVHHTGPTQVPSTHGHIKPTDEAAAKRVGIRALLYSDTLDGSHSGT